MINDQLYITTELKKALEKMIILPWKQLNNLVFIVVGILLSRSTLLSKIAEELKSCYTDVDENSKVKRIYRFFSNKKFKPETIYFHFTHHLIKRYIKRSNNNKAVIIFDHTTIDDRFLILKFSLKVGKRAVSLTP